MAKVQLFTKNNIRIFVSDMTDIANVAVNKHNARPLGALVLATSIAVFGPLTTIKRNTKTSAILNGDGNSGTIIVESTQEGYIRTSIANPSVITEYDKINPNGIPIGIGIGQVGTLKILQTVGKLTYSSETKLAKGDIVTDMAYYYEVSEQTKSAVVSSIFLGKDSYVERAYSVIMQMLPGYTEEDVVWIEGFLRQNQLGKMKLNNFIQAMKATKLEEKILEWKCSCSKEKFKEILDTMTSDEKKEIIKEYGSIEIKCNFCGEKQKFK